MNKLILHVDILYNRHYYNAIQFGDINSSNSCRNIDLYIDS